MATAHITLARLREFFEFSTESGLFVRRMNRRRFKAGDVAGHLRSDGYIRIKIDGRFYMAHRLVWLYQTGTWPTNQIDHIDGNRANNRFENLREATNAENQHNQRTAHRNTLSGLLGVAWNKKSGKWTAQIVIDGKNRHIGYFLTAEAAHAAYISEKRTIHPFGTL